MARSPFGPAAASQGGRYLGVWLSAAAAGALQEGQRWERAALDAVASGIWQHPVDISSDRSKQMT
eukprot:11215166-Lingulodinium_polyedra.AAC.1